MHFARCNADFTSETEFAAICKLGRRIVHQNSGIEASEKQVNCLFIFGNNRLCMVGIITVDVINCALYTIDCLY